MGAETMERTERTEKIEKTEKADKLEKTGQEKHAARYIGKLSNQIRRRIDSFSSRTNFSGSQGKILHFVLAQKSDVFQKDIEEEFSLRPSTATELLKKMEQNGLIYREALPEDARKKRVIVTDKALQYREIVMRDLLHLEEELTKDISKKDLEIFFQVLEKMLDNIT